MLNNMLENIEKKIKQKSIYFFPYSNVIGLSRSILAFGTLITLLFNSESVLIHKTNVGVYLNPFINSNSFLFDFNFFALFGIENFIFSKIIAILILCLVISGYFIKITSILHWWISISFFMISSVIDGGDQITSILTLLLLPLCLTDKRKNHWCKIIPFYSPYSLMGVFSVYIIRLQMAVVYFHAAVGKFNVEEWANGTALYYWLNHSFFGSPDFIIPSINFILSNKWINPILTYSVLIFELLLFLAFTASIKYRKRILTFGIIFHLSIVFLHGIFSFFFAMVAGLIIYLYPSNESINLKFFKNEQ